MTRELEDWLDRFFGDDARRDLGSGWISGVLSVILGLLAICAVLALHFPQWLTVPELRSRYPIDLVRLIIDWAIFATMVLAAISLVLRRKKTLGLAGLALVAVALVLGAGGVELGRSDGTGFYVGLDWFILGVLTTAAIFVPLERAFALRPRQGTFRRGWLTDAQYFFMSHALVQLMSVLVLLPAVNLGGALALDDFERIVQGWPLAVQFLACLAVADLAQYWVHRAFHRIPLLWRFHKVHHSVEAMDWIAGSRLHLVDVIVTRGLVLLPLVMLGFDDLAVYAYLGFVSVHAVFIHANFAPRSEWIERILVMPRFHHWHHAREAEAIDTNFAVHLPLLDRLFGTCFLPRDRWPQAYGVDGVEAPDGYLRQLAWPFFRAKPADH